LQQKREQVNNINVLASALKLDWVQKYASLAIVDKIKNIEEYQTKIDEF
jgi:hypothetical protein